MSRSEAADGIDDRSEKPPQAPDAAPSTPVAAPESKPPLIELFELDPDSTQDEQIAALATRHIRSEAGRHEVASHYNVLAIYDSSSLARTDANRIYSAVNRCKSDLPLLLVLRSRGGSISAAYLIAKLCRERSSIRFDVAVPRDAKSAATLICCAADRIHMGSLSELGPIDPQFDNRPALALKHSVEHVAQLASQYPAATQMFSEYLAKSLRVDALGYYERVAESAMHYALRLLQTRTNPGDAAANEQIAQRLVYSYKDHSFVIDSREASEIFGEKVVLTDTAEYKLANSLYAALDLVEFIIRDRLRRQFYFIGDLQDGAHVFSPRPRHAAD
jgi:Serine dehydrogenase proteinase